MKNIIIILCISLFISNSAIFSQLTLTSSYNPVSGDIGKFFHCDTAGILQGDSGMNQIWNFSNLHAFDSSISNYVNPVNTPYFSTFPTSNVASYDSIESSDVFSFYKTSWNKYEYLGYAYPGFLEILSNTEDLMQYPFSYGNAYIDTFSGSGTLSGFPFVVIGTMNKSGDAAGTISLPFGTYSNALRIKSIQTETDSAIGFPFVFSVTSVEYSWYVDEFKFPVFTVYYYTTVENGDTTIGKEVYYSNSQPIGITQNGKLIPETFCLYQNYPNPFNPSTKIKFDIPTVGTRHAVSLRIYDILGREIATLVNGQLNAGTYEIEWNASNYPSGVYL